MLVGLSVKRVVREPLASRYLMVMQAEEGEKRYLTINVGEKEGEAVECWLSSITPPRPMTYDLITELFNLTGDIKVSKIVIDGCDRDVFYAKMMLSVNGKEKIIDCRPSDAVAIGVRLGAPIYAELRLLDLYGFLSD